MPAEISSRFAAMSELAVTPEEDEAFEAMSRPPAPEPAAPVKAMTYEEHSLFIQTNYVNTSGFYKYKSGF